MANRPGTFKKGDPRINRNGRPKTQEKLRKLILQVLSEPAIERGTGEPLVKDGKIITQGEAIVRKWVADNPELLFAYAFGKPEQSLNVSGEIEVPVTIVEVVRPNE